jgi:Beta-propeller repeat
VKASLLCASFEPKGGYNAAKMNGNRVLKFFLIQIVLVSFVVVPLPSTAGSPDFLWLRTAGNSAMEVSFSLAVDSVGNSYIGGYFNSTNVSFGNGVFITNVVTTASPPWDVFMAKYNPHGEIVWAKGFGGSDDDRARAIAVDSQGDCFVTGRFYSTNFSIGGVFLTNSVPRGNSAIFVAKFDGLGNLLWARVPDKGYSQSGSGIAVDSLGNCYVTGSFSGTNTFAGTNLISRGSTDVLLLKYDPSGNLLWAKRAGGNDLDAGAAVATDVSGNVCLLANIRGTNVIFDSFNFSADAGIVDQDIVVAKYDGLGRIIWAKEYGGTNKAGFTLQCSTNLLPSSDWIAVESDRVVSGSRYVVTSPIDSENKFYRLKR